MLTVNKAKKGNLEVFQIVGPVDDRSNFDESFGPVPDSPTEIHVNCAQVTRINSVGVKSWIKYFQKVQAKNLKLVFHECAPPIVQQMNMVFNFLCGGKVATLLGPFACEACGNNFLSSLKVADIQSSNFNIQPIPCSKCQKPAEFDDVPKLCFKFLTHRPGR